MSSAAARRPNNMRSNTLNRSMQHSDGARMSNEPNRTQRVSDVEIDGVYKNPNFTFNLTTLIGCTVEVHVQNGKRYEGIFKTYSPDLEVVLECVHLIDTANRDRTPTKDRIIETLIINFNDLVNMSACNADTRYGETDSFTDSAIAKGQLNGVGTRELTPFHLDASETTDVNLDEISTSSTGGWNPEKMFKVHEDKFGVKSNFDETLYTTKLPSADSPGFHRRMAEAERHASEIEANATSRRNTALENGEREDEESRYSAVTRPSTQPSNNRYVAPQLRGRGGVEKFSESSPKQLSQSMRVNGRSGHGRHPPEQQKAPHGKSIESLKTWNSKFNLKDNAVPPQAVQSAVNADHQSSPQAPEAKSSPVTGEPTQKVKSPPPQSTTSPKGSHATASPVAIQPTQAPNTASQPALVASRETSKSVSPPQNIPAADADTESAVQSQGDKVCESEVKSTLNPNAKEFVFNMKAAVSNPAAVAPQSTNHHPPPPQQQAYKSTNKTAIVSVQEARPPNPKVPEMPSAAQAMGAPVTQQQYYIVQQHPRLQRIPSYPEGPTVAGHNMPAHSQYPVTAQQFVPNGMGGPVNIQQAMPGQPHNGAMPAGPPHNGQPLPQQLAGPHHSQPGGSHPPMHGPAQPSQQQMHPPNAAFSNNGQFVYPLQPGQPGGPHQQAGPPQPPLQPSPHNPSPSPAPSGNGPAVSYPSFSHPPAGPFHQVPQAHQIVYIHPHSQMHGQFPAQMYPYPVQGYQPQSMAPQ